MAHEEIELIKGKPEKCMACGKKELGTLRDYYYLKQSPPPDTPGGEVRLGPRGFMTILKMKECQRCRYVQLYSLTEEEEIRFTEKESI